LPCNTSPSDRGAFAAELQRRLAAAGTPYQTLEEEQTSLEAVYLDAMSEAQEAPTLSSTAAAGGKPVSGIGARKIFASLRNQGRMIRHALPFYVSSWWRRGDLSWVMYLNAFVLLLVGGTSLFGQLPGAAGAAAQRFAGGPAPPAGLLPPLFFMSFALLESIKSPLCIWWEQGV